MRTVKARLRAALALRRRRSRWQRVGLAALTGLVTVLLPVGGAAVALRMEYAGEPSAEARTRGRDAVWLGHAWVDGHKGEADLTTLTRLLAGTGVRDLYVRTGPLEHDVAQQTALALEATPPGVDLLLGLPAYWDDTFGHRGSAETVAAAVRGARLSLGRHAPGRQTFGLALYADFSATLADWAAFRDGWSG
ncbi:hypothetical protein [Kitasatospora sp. MAP5-34]|uniref:hypothetical protein n=1 Tax=Kitasatospora sp. MAP5-34 TaxID=3035102 RepID=UPI0024758930|nr:hypothetical protein [Kitasatospora sp. MAP5-34]MDH6580595.1 hypothetical protein [Kitasatospora sp. MAP5-34]